MLLAQTIFALAKLGRQEEQTRIAPPIPSLSSSFRCRTNLTHLQDTCNTSTQPSHQMPLSIRKEIGLRLRGARLKAGLTQDEVCIDFERTRQAVSAWECGAAMPTLLELRELATLYVVSADHLLFGVDDMASSRQEAMSLFQMSAQPKKPDFADSTF